MRTVGSSLRALGMNGINAPQRPDCVTGHIGLELRNVGAKYPFERSHRFLGIQPNSCHRDCSRLSCGVRDVQLGPSVRISAGTGLSARKERVWSSRTASLTGSTPLPRSNGVAGLWIGPKSRRFLPSQRLIKPAQTWFERSFGSAVEHAACSAIGQEISASLR